MLSNISEQNGLSDYHVRSVLKDQDGFVWIGTTDGLNLADGSTIHVFRHTDNDSSSLPDNNIGLPGWRIKNDYFVWQSTKHAMDH